MKKSVWTESNRRVQNKTKLNVCLNISTNGNLCMGIVFQVDVAPLVWLKQWQAHH